MHTHWVETVLASAEFEPTGQTVQAALPAAALKVPARDGQTSSHRPRLVVSRSTCPPFPPSPPREQLCNRYCSNKHTRCGIVAAPVHAPSRAPLPPPLLPPPPSVTQSPSPPRSLVRDGQTRATQPPNLRLCLRHFGFLTSPHAIPTSHLTAPPPASLLPPIFSQSSARVLYDVAIRN